ncbi:hypothetical protein [Brevibacillus porteri]|uniref:hypothetical protein n=1 Tax=Brevibacillus porteri TaxID=2126350 RepID=UPI003637B30F
MKKDLNWYFNVIKEFVSELQKHEDNPYFLASITRISSTIDAAKLLNDYRFDLESPVMLRIAIEHAARIGYLKKNPEKFVQFTDMTKVFGKGPQFAVTLEVFESGSKLIYELVSAFSHPDALSLTMSQDNSQEGKTEILFIINSVAAAFLLDMLLITYPHISKPISEEEYEELKATLFLTIVESIEVFSERLPEELKQVNPEVFANVFGEKSKIGAPIVEFASTLNGNVEMDVNLFLKMVKSFDSKNKPDKK